MQVTPDDEESHLLHVRHLIHLLRVLHLLLLPLAVACNNALLGCTREPRNYFFIGRAVESRRWTQGRQSCFEVSWPRVLGLIGMVLALVAVVMVARAQIQGRSGAATALVTTSGSNAAKTSLACDSLD